MHYIVEKNRITLWAEASLHLTYGLQYWARATLSVVWIAIFVRIKSNGYHYITTFGKHIIKAIIIITATGKVFGDACGRIFEEYWKWSKTFLYRIKYIASSNSWRAKCGHWQAYNIKPFSKSRRWSNLEVTTSVHSQGHDVRLATRWRHWFILKITTSIHVQGHDVNPRSRLRRSGAAISGQTPSL